MKRYEHLAQTERYYIYMSLQSGISLRKIANKINRSVSTISRELKRNKGKRGYLDKQAQAVAKARQRDKVKAKLPFHLLEIVFKMLRQDYSPEQISGRLALEYGYKISHESIYSLILKDKKAGGKLYKHLRCQRKKKRRYAKPDRRGQIPNRVFISERPEIVNNRSRLGDWEADLVESHKGGELFLTILERKSRVYLVKKVENKKADIVKNMILQTLMPIKDFVHTITFDNGKEFAYHSEISEKLNANSYFATPYHSWERGSNENSNGLLRQYFPKGKSIKDVSVMQVAEITMKLNNRPRKCLGFKTPFEVFVEEAQSVALST